MPPPSRGVSSESNRTVLFGVQFEGTKDWVVNDWGKTFTSENRMDAEYLAQCMRRVGAVVSVSEYSQ
jgi:hypothetical protein